MYIMCVLSFYCDLWWSNWNDQTEKRKKNILNLQQPLAIQNKMLQTDFLVKTESECF